jgi:NADH oxidase (H2O2-forming)
MMGNYDIVILGGGPAGVQSALSARNSWPGKTIALIRKDEVPMFPCGIPYVFHTLKSVDENILPDTPLEKSGVKIIVGEVSGRSGKTLHLADDRDIGFDRLVLAFGSLPETLPIEGSENESIYTVGKNYEYLKKFRKAIDGSDDILIIGGGYIGVEIADELSRAGRLVTIVEMMPSLLPNTMDPEFGDTAEEELEKQGCKVVTGVKVEKIKGDGKTIGAELEDGNRIDADIVIIAAGYRPNVEMAKKMWVAADPEYGVLVDEYLRTSVPDIYAAGDCVASRNSFTGEYTNAMLASTAMAQGRLAGSNLYGINVFKTFSGTLSSFSTKVGNTALAVTGLTETQAREMDIGYFVGQTDTVDHHPSCLPGTREIRTKLVFARKTHHLLGAQVSGGDSVGELVNMLSVMIQNKMTDMEIDTLQIGTHPLLTPSPLGYSVINAAVNGILKWYHK